MSRFLLPLLLLPFVELYLLVLIAHRVGVGPLLALIVLSGVLGSALARREGVRVLRHWQEAVSQRRVPEEGLLSGVLVFVGGVLLVLPGVVSDLVGLALLVPVTRRVVARWLRRSVERHLASGSLRVTTFSGSPFPGGPFPPSAGEPLPPVAPPRPRIGRGPGPEVDAEFTEEKGERGRAGS